MGTSEGALAMLTNPEQISANAFPGMVGAALEYMIDAGQRSVLFLDVMRQRGEQYREHVAESAPHVLNFSVELLVDGRTLNEPVNYALVAIVPPAGTAIDNQRRPFIVVDPRAGHGPGIGGFKADSEIGVTMQAGHPCYFIGFLPDPMPGQTIEKIARAEALFIETVIARHPDADGKPCIIGNCQAGWAVMMLASIRPELFGPLIIAGSPLSYWAGVRGKNPMRYTGGLLGGSWLAALTSDLGGGKFDGAWLVQNFENLNPSNTYWSKQYNVYSKVDTEAERYLEFERWWGGHVNLNAEEIQFIVDELFVGNKLVSGEIKFSDGTPVDLRNIRSPIVVVCSKGDNITPPQQALGWVLDLYKDVDEIRSYGQTIVYTVHETIGHLGIFVSGSVATKEHAEFTSNIDLIDVLPPGLYEATFEAREGESDTVGGKWIMRCEQRTLDDLRAMGRNSEGDERRFATAARVSEINLALYRKFVQPWVQRAAAPTSDLMQRMHPLRLQYEMFGGNNPLMRAVERGAEVAREQRKPARDDNPFLKAQNAISEQIVTSLDRWRDQVEAASEAMFLWLYGSPALQAAVGIDPESATDRAPGMSAQYRELLDARIAELKANIGKGGIRECVVRSLLYIGSTRGMVDERSLEALRRIRKNDNEQMSNEQMSLAAFKSMVREQFFMLLLDQAATLAAIPAMLPESKEDRQKAVVVIRSVLSASGEITGATAERLEQIIQLFLGDFDRHPGTNTLSFDRQSKAS